MGSEMCIRDRGRSAQDVELEVLSAPSSDPDCNETDTKSEFSGGESQLSTAQLFHASQTSWDVLSRPAEILPQSS